MSFRWFVVVYPISDSERWHSPASLRKTKRSREGAFLYEEAIWIPQNRLKILGVVLDNGMNVIPGMGWTSLRFSLRISHVQ